MTDKSKVKTTCVIPVVLSTGLCPMKTEEDMYVCDVSLGSGFRRILAPSTLGALLGFERWQSANKDLPLGSVKYHLGSIGGVEASRIEVVFDGISPSRFGATSWSFGDVRTSVGSVVVGKMMWLVAWCVHGCFGC